MDAPIIPEELSSASSAIGKLCESTFSGPAVQAARRSAGALCRSNVLPVLQHHQFGFRKCCQDGCALNFRDGCILPEADGYVSPANQDASEGYSSVVNS